LPRFRILQFHPSRMPRISLIRPWPGGSWSAGYNCVYRIYPRCASWALRTWCRFSDDASPRSWFVIVRSWVARYRIHHQHWKQQWFGRAGLIASRRIVGCARLLPWWPRDLVPN